MKAVRFHEYGDPDVLRYEDVAQPVPGIGEVRVRPHVALAEQYDDNIFYRSSHTNSISRFRPNSSSAAWRRSFRRPFFQKVSQLVMPSQQTLDALA